MIITPEVRAVGAVILGFFMALIIFVPWLVWEWDNADAKKKRAEALLNRLAPYTDHLPDCPAHMRNRRKVGYKCECGLSDALAAAILAKEE